MEDEIKEILDNFKIYEERYKKFNETQFIIIYRDIHLLLNYITNLQEEIEKLKQWDNNKDSRNSRQRVANKKLQKRIDKAIEYIEENSSDYWDNGKLLYREINADNVINILKGKDNE